MNRITAVEPKVIIIFQKTRVYINPSRRTLASYRKTIHHHNEAGQQKGLIKTYNMIKCLLQFYQEQHWLDFRYAELNAVIELAGLVPSELYDASQLNAEDKAGPYLRIQFPDEASIRFICSRCILIKAVFEYWVCGNSLIELADNVRGLPTAFTDAFYQSELSWSIQLDTFFKNLTMEEKHECRDKFRFMDFRGPVKLENADMQYCILMDFSSSSREESCRPQEAEDIFCFFGRLLGLGGMKEGLKKYSLKKRLYLGPTSVK
jgi:tRNA (guanine10-N2)-methyltransferase